MEAWDAGCATSRWGRLSVREMRPSEGGEPSRWVGEVGVLALGSLLALAVAGLLVTAGAPALVSGLTLFTALTAVVALSLAISMRQAR